MWCKFFILCNFVVLSAAHAAPNFECIVDAYPQTIIRTITNEDSTSSVVVHVGTPSEAAFKAEESESSVEFLPGEVTYNVTFKMDVGATLSIRVNQSQINPTAAFPLIGSIVNGEAIGVCTAIRTNCRAISE